MAKKSESKYAEVVIRLPEREPDDPGRQARVEEIQDVIKTRDPRELAQMYAELRGDRAKVEDELSSINLTIEALEQLIAKSQKNQDAGWGLYGAKDNMIRLPQGGNVRVDLDVHSKVIDKEANRLWCIANGYERQLQIWPSRMTTITKERLLVGQPEPDGVEATTWRKVIYTKGG